MYRIVSEYSWGERMERGGFATEDEAWRDMVRVAVREAESCMEEGRTITVDFLGGKSKAEWMTDLKWRKDGTFVTERMERE